MARIGSLMAKVFGSLLFSAVFVLNVMVFIQHDSSTGNLSLTSLKAFAQTGGSGSGSGGCGSGCAAGYGCANGICHQLQIIISEPCTRSKKCGLFNTVTTYGFNKQCKTDPGGTILCDPVPCDAIQPTCP